MVRFADLFITSGFATGMVRYKDFYPGETQGAHIVLAVIVGGHMTVPAIVDTGAPWCIFAPDTMRDVAWVEYVPGIKLLIRGTWYVGRLVRVTISLRAERGGDDLDVDATVFVPTLPPGAAWPHPNFIGLDGFLNRIRFAVDPSDNVFYFGPA